MWTEYNKEGRLMYIKRFSHGEAHGLWKEFFENGTIKFEGAFKNDERDGTHRWWNRNGKLEKSVFYISGTIGI